MLFKLKSYFQFLLKSTNQHGVHSPFVFDLVTQCFYKKKLLKNTPILFPLDKKQVSKKQIELVSKLITYFNSKKILKIDSKTKSSKNGFVTEDKTFDFIFFEKTPPLSCFIKYLKTTHNNSVFVFNTIYYNKETLQIWAEIKKHSKVTVTIDTFELGIVFFRKEQAKEHFTIRM